MRLRAWTKLLVVSMGLWTATSVLAQTDSSITGTVTTQDGKPVAGVSVSGGVWKTCCPQQREQATTDQNGRFRIEQPSGILYFVKDTLQPKIVVVRSDKSPVHITLEPATDNLVVPVCGKVARGHRRIGWSTYGLHFDVAERDAKILGGKPDVDYVRYVIQPNTGDAYMELWFGPYAISLTPHDEQFINSDRFAQRTIVNSAGGWIGMDSWGQQHGGSWRRTARAAQGGAIYENVSAEQAHLFDRIINSLCEVPYPRQ